MNQPACIGNSERREDTVWPQLVRALAATLDVPMPSAPELPPLWHWILFQDWAPAAALGADGHAGRDGLLPLDPALPRRMWAGGRLTFNHPLRIGERVARESVISAIEEKTGSSGRLRFVNIRHTIADSRGVALIEDQDLVYREPPGASTGTPPAAEPVSGSAASLIAIDAPLLFRYSAVTGNSHRIHYDKEYAKEEGYAGLVVHGPLQATLLAAFALRQRAAGDLAEFSFRGRHAALLHCCPLTLQAWPHESGLRLRSVDREGVICTTAEAKFNS